MSDRKQILDLFEQYREYTDQKVADGIEKYRKGDACVTLTGENGQPLSGMRMRFWYWMTLPARWTIRQTPVFVRRSENTMPRLQRSLWRSVSALLKTAI